jgi:hypothetical protein
MAGRVAFKKSEIKDLRNARIPVVRIPLLSPLSDFLGDEFV